MIPDSEIDYVAVDDVCICGHSLGVHRSNLKTDSAERKSRPPDGLLRCGEAVRFYSPRWEKFFERPCRCAGFASKSNFADDKERAEQETEDFWEEMLADEAPAEKAVPEAEKPLFERDVLSKDGFKG